MDNYHVKCDLDTQVSVRKSENQKIKIKNEAFKAGLIHPTLYKQNARIDFNPMVKMLILCP